MSAQADYIWSLVSGLPSFKRGKHLMLMLQVYADESWTNKGPRIFALGGFIAPTEIWARFSDEWQRVLDMKPRMDYFKWDEAVHLKGEFAHWREWRRDERVKLLQNVIQAFRPGFCFFALRMDDYEEAFAGTRFAKSAYGLAITVLCRDVLRGLKTVWKFPDAPVDFYFDEQLKEQEEVFKSWKTARHRMELEYRDRVFQKLFVEGNPPAFRNDKLVLPIQAADMLVGYAARKLSDRVAKGLSILPPGKHDFPLWFSAKTTLYGRMSVKRKEDLMKDRKRLDMLGEKWGEDWT